MTAPITSLPAAVAALGALPMPAGPADSTAVDASVARLRWLLAEPPAGHSPAQQPADWYEQVFDLLATTHPETCTAEETTS